MKRLMGVLMILVCGGCAASVDTLSAVVTFVPTFLEFLKKVSCVALAAAVLVCPLIGCTIQMYPKAFDTPAGQKAILDSFTSMQKQFAGKAHIYNPRTEFYQKTAFGVSLDGVGGDIQLSGDETGQMTTTQPAK